MASLNINNTAKLAGRIRNKVKEILWTQEGTNYRVWKQNLVFTWTKSYVFMNRHGVAD